MSKYLILLFMLKSTVNYAQVLFNNYGQLHIKPGAFVIVKTNSVNNGQLLENEGEFTIEKDFINNDSTIGGASGSIFNVQENWINNSIFIAGESKMNLYGDNQLISGNTITAFYDMELTGSGIKRQTVNSEVRNNLNLNDRELATDQYEMLVSNVDPAAISRTCGFVSSLDNGKLSRYTDQSTEYEFPTGSSQGVFRYRPIYITPESTAFNSFGVRLANTDPSNENFNREIKENELCEINPLFYHRIYQNAGNDAAEIKYNYLPAQDGDWSTITHWQGQPQWENTNPITLSTSSNFSQLALSNWSDFDQSPFALATPAPTINASNDTIINRGTPVRLLASGNNALNAFDWSPSDNLDCYDCQDPIAVPTESTRYVVLGNPGSNCEAKDSVFIEVREKNTDIFLPNAFSPNADGNNDFLRLYGNLDKIKSLELLIFNRWGEKVFEANNIEDAEKGWDGAYKGADLAPDVFSYQLKVDFENKNQKYNQKGSITLVK